MTEDDKVPCEAPQAHEIETDAPLATAAAAGGGSD